MNGVTQQEDSTAHMMFKIPRMIEHISSIMTLEVRAAPLASVCRVGCRALIWAAGGRPGPDGDAAWRRPAGPWRQGGVHAD